MSAGAAAGQGPLGWIWPRSLAGRTALSLLLALTLIQVAGLTIHALDRVDLQRFTQAREISSRAISAWRTVVLAPPDRRAQMLAELKLPTGLAANLNMEPRARKEFPPIPTSMARMLRLDVLEAAPPRFRPREVQMGYSPTDGTLEVSLRLPSGEWLNLGIQVPPPRPWHSETFLVSFLVMSVAGGLLILWAVRRLTAPVRALADAADRLGRDVNADPLPENGPSEVATAARAFNTMAERIRRFVGDRTQLLAAVSHDLRTPITRLRLRAEFMEDDDQRRRMLADLDELEAMVNATLAFGRDATASEPAGPVDLAALVNTVLTEAGDTRPELPAEALSYAGPDHLTITARPVALKRALTNLVANALNYGGTARVHLMPPEDGQVALHVDDDGPGIPPDELERVFLPFQRLEPSRNRETGGMGLGLPITRNIARAHGGDVTLQNRSVGGLRATLTLPA